MIVGYGLIGIRLLALFTRLSHRIEPAPPRRSVLRKHPRLDRFLGQGDSRNAVLRPEATFSLDAFPGGFIMQSLMVLWLSERFGVRPAALGAIFSAPMLLWGSLL